MHSSKKSKLPSASSSSSFIPPSAPLTAKYFNGKVGCHPASVVIERAFNSSSSSSPAVHWPYITHCCSLSASSLLSLLIVVVGHAVATGQQHCPYRHSCWGNGDGCRRKDDVDGALVLIIILAGATAGAMRTTLRMTPSSSSSLLVIVGQRWQHQRWHSGSCCAGGGWQQWGTHSPPRCHCEENSQWQRQQRCLVVVMTMSAQAVMWGESASPHPHCPRPQCSLKWGDDRDNNILIAWRPQKR